MVREGKSGKQKVIGYAETQEEAMIMLASYNKDSWDIDKSKITFSELYEDWKKKRAWKLAANSKKNMQTAYNQHCSSLYQMRYGQIKTHHMQDCIDTGNLGASTQKSIKTLFYHLDRYAMELDIIDKSYSALVTTSSREESNRTVFSEEEISLLWENAHLPWVDSILFLLYTGFRVSEMLDLRVENMDQEMQTVMGGSKTTAGKNRIVPIHSIIQPIVQKRVQASSAGFLFDEDGKKITYNHYIIYWNRIMRHFQMHHVPHECRHTFRSRMDSAGANKVCIDRIMGHKSAGTGERIYTHKTIEELKENIELIN